jgi:hypothetical protein
MAEETTNNANGGDGSILEPGVRYYLFLGFAGLVVLWLVLMEAYDLFALAPAFAGVIGLAMFLAPPGFRFLRKPLYFAPILVLITLVIFGALFENVPEESIAMDALAAGALVIYLSAQYRLFGLGAAAAPIDTRPRLDRAGGDLPESRAPDQVAPREPARLLVAIAMCVVAGQLLWRWIVADWAVTGSQGSELRVPLKETAGRMASLIWLVGVGALVLLGFFRVLRAYRMSADESVLIGADTLWAETRGEQRRLARWHAWRRRKHDRRLEKQP